MPKIVLIEKTGTLKTLNVKDLSEASLYKKAGLKVSDGFTLQHTWGTDDGLDQSIRLYAKTNGRAGQENKYDFPPPVDNTLFFGPCILVGYDNSDRSLVDIDAEEWEEIYEFLFGGFEEIGESDEEEDVDTEDELDALEKGTGAPIKQTKQGYVKDGFIVDDDEADEYGEDTEQSSDISSDDDTPPRYKMPTPKPRKTAWEMAETTAASDKCESELSEESYV